MKTYRSNTRIVLASVVLILSSIALTSAEDLYVIEKRNAGLNSLAKTEGINVYGVLNNIYLVGANPQGLMEIGKPGIEAEYIDARDESSEYFIFRVRESDLDKIRDEIEIIYQDGDEAIGKSGGPLSESIQGLLHRLTRISFVPRPVIQSGAAPVFEPLTDPQIEAIVALVSETQYTAYIQTMQDFGTRYSYTAGCRAAEQWAENTLAGFGYTAELFPFTYGGNTWNNVIGRKTGLAHPDSIYIIIGHLDATSENPYTSAPGAEDNASGSACVLEAARVLSQIDLDCTIEFILATGEEQGLIGSEEYAQYCLSQNRNIAGVFNFDMISYAGAYGWDTNIFSDQNFPAEVALADLLGISTDEYTLAYSERVNTSGPEYGSDHYYFSLYGFPAPFSIDAQLWSAPDWYPWYHTTNDLISRLDLDFGTEVVKGAVATLATVAGLYSPPVLVFNYPDGLPELIDPQGGTSFRVEVLPGTESPQPGTGNLFYDGGSGFESLPMQVVSPNVYDAVFPAISCATIVPFYLSAQSTVGTVVTDPVSAPTATYSALSAENFSVIYETDFDVNDGWAMDGLWGIGQPAGGGGEHGYPDPTSDHSPDGLNNVLGYNLSGDYENYLPERMATSPAIDCSDIFGVALNFYRWLGVEQPIYDHAYVRVSTDGTTWTTVWENSSEITENSWHQQQIDLSPWADGQPNLRIRFVMGETDVGWRYCGWNIDDLVITGYDCAVSSVGACCDPLDFTCQELAEAECLAQGGSFEGLGTVCLGDSDGDGADGSCDNCPDDYNPGQEDSDDDGIGDVCDTQADVPTLSQWAMLFMGLLLILAGTTALVRRRRTETASAG